ncbi:hypothetical protein FC78_GL001850 [Companilactobacillus bobalius DSM 19674]|uniref:Uncharacterized protein n=1 Tax=Companilactobacillus bobalius DSM 19674 TaxID=1423788 RepID=A0A0R1KSJ2_9LACO|nr:hypothetical protein FC78_GL001850 [Companilactobacillus bobalius DSM 19674]
MLSRLEKGGKVLIIMTRWASGDLAGRVLTETPINRLWDIQVRTLYLRCKS